MHFHHRRPRPAEPADPAPGVAERGAEKAFRSLIGLSVGISMPECSWRKPFAPTTCPHIAKGSITAIAVAEAHRSPCRSAGPQRRRRRRCCRGRGWRSSVRRTAISTSPIPRLHVPPGSPCCATTRALHFVLAARRRYDARRRSSLAMRLGARAGATRWSSTVSFSGNAFSVKKARGRFRSPRGHDAVVQNDPEVRGRPLDLFGCSARRRTTACAGRARARVRRDAPPPSSRPSARPCWSGSR